jgi:hypothetical protein
MISFQCATAEEARALLDAVAGIDKIPQISGVREYLEAKDIPKERPNVNPGPPGISRIHKTTEDLILAELKQGRQPNPEAYKEHLRLLWQRCQVKFDGKEYYLDAD